MKTLTDLTFKGFLIEKGTRSEITEILSDNSFKIYFESKTNPDHEECLQILDTEETRAIFGESFESEIARFYAAIELDTSEIENDFGDIYRITKLSPTLMTDKKKEVAFYDSIDAVAEEALKKMLMIMGVDVLEFSNYTAIKEIAEIAINKAREFGAEIPYVNENY